jgi:tRNA threonylcarbamoyladenosine biosynthesis protein TsaE
MTIFAELRAGVVSSSAEETRRLAARLAAALPPDATLALHGDLGVGKTTFVQGLAAGFCLSDQVTSPTFNILHLYRGAPAGRPFGRQDPLRRDPGERGFNLVHLDAYRIENAHQVAELMLDDFLASPYCLAVEWPEKIAAWLPAGTLHLTLGIEAPGRHRIMLA